MIREVLPRVVAGETLSEEQAALVMQDVLAGAATSAQIAGFAVALRMRGETVDEVAGLARAMRRALQPFPAVPRPLLDTCGTGGDGSGTFNVSTATAFVAAAAGAHV
ncbi:MAG: anthranilate phosphoribosyltransferase, partial [Candidatus Eisenbacteria bacterium]